MSCQKHIQRKRPTSCPDCAAEVALPLAKMRANIAVAKAKVEEKVIVKTSRDMLADLEKEEEQMVVKKERKKREVVINTTDPVSLPELPPTSEDVSELVTKRIALVQVAINSYFDNKFAEFKARILSLSTVQWEHLSIPAGKCNMETISILEKDGWKYVDMYVQDNIIKLSGFTAPVAVFTRVKSDARKKTVVETKKEFK